MTLSLRAAGHGDAETIAELNAVVHALHVEHYPWLFKPQGFDADAIAKMMARDEVLFVLAEADANAAGYVFAELQRVPEREITFAYDMLFIHHIGVLDRFRRKGVARALVDHVTDIAKAHGVARVATSYWSFNAESAAFFTSMGLAPYRVHAWR